MSLAPTRSEFSTPVVFNKTGGDANMPSTLQCYVESTPIIRGVYKKKIYFPTLASLTTTATTTTYVPEAIAKINLTSAFKNSRSSIFRGATSEGGISIPENGSTISIVTLATTNTMEMTPLDIETIGF